MTISEFIIIWVIFAIVAIALGWWLDREPSHCPKCKSKDINPIGYYGEKHRCNSCENIF